jgi:hypothetical protein
MGPDGIGKAAAQAAGHFQRASRRVLKANGFRVTRALCFDDLPSALPVYEQETAVE